MSRPLPCACGKTGWLNRAAAADVLVRAKISYSLYGNKRRREQRVYECTVRRGTFHLTSQPARKPSGLIEPPTYALDDMVAAREYISGALFHDDARAWEVLLAPDRADQTLHALGAMHQAVLLEANRRKALDGGHAEYRAWQETTRSMQNILISRIADARQAVKRANIARSENRVKQEGAYYRAMVRRLVLEIAEHRKTQDTIPSSADRRLWDLLDAIRLPRATVSVGEIVASGQWCFADVEHPLDGRVDLKGEPS